MIKKYPLKLVSILSLVVIVLAAVISAVFGVNTSTEIGGGGKVEVQLTYTVSGEEKNDINHADNYAKKVDAVLKKHGASMDCYYVEDKNIDTYLVITTNKTKIKDQGTIAQDIADALNIDVTRVSGYSKLSSYFTSNILLQIGLASLCMVILCFFAAWIRYGILAAVTIILSILYNIILGLSFIFLSRVQFSMISLYGVLALTVFAVFGLVVILEREKANKKCSTYNKLSNDKNLMVATKQSKGLALFVAIMLITCIVLLCLPVRHIRFASLSLLLGLLATCINIAISSPTLYSFLQTIKDNRQKTKLSRNNLNNNK